MKILFLTTLTAIMLASFSFAGPVIHIKITLEFGKKSQPNCPGFGLCKCGISFPGSQDGSVNGAMDINTDKMSMIIGVNEKDIVNIQPEKIVYFKGKSVVTFEEDYVFLSEFNTAAKITRPIIIKKGTYPLTYKNEYYYIEFPL